MHISHCHPIVLALRCNCQCVHRFTLVSYLPIVSDKKYHFWIFIPTNLYALCTYVTCYLAIICGLAEQMWIAGIIAWGGHVWKITQMLFDYSHGYGMIAVCVYVRRCVLCAQCFPLTLCRGWPLCSSLITAVIAWVVTDVWCMRMVEVVQEFSVPTYV